MIGSLYNQGFEFSKEAINMFNLEKENLQAGFLWTSKHIDDSDFDPKIVSRLY